MSAILCNFVSVCQLSQSFSFAGENSSTLFLCYVGLDFPKFCRERFSV